MTSLNDIRSTFLDYFEKNGHMKVPSSPLVPKNDPTLMFTNSGMVQFKNIFTGQETRDYSRAVTSQKCVRAGGKHNDLDNVGYTARHHTFFEMLGNFSFGDYFKDDAIPFAWNLITKEFGLPKEKLLVTVYHDDDEAAEIWKKVAGLPDERIIRIATNDNFWMMGPTGPCGPSSEIFFDHGDHIPGGPPGSPDEDGDRFIEIWNLVFMQFEQFEDESREALPKPSIDTGMGLERIGAILQGKHDNYDTDLMRNLIEASAHATSVDPDGDTNIHHRVIADHLRSTSFLIADGVMPSNVGRGYVLRRIMRRAMRHAYLVGAKDPLMHRLVPVLAQNMGQAFPELVKSQSLIEETLKHEETRFRANLERGLRLLDDEIDAMGARKTLAGDAAFKLYDTYGFPLDLTQDALREKGLAVDVAGFEAAMSEQKAKARAAWSGSGESKEAPIWFELSERLEPSEFLGYEQDEAEAVISALVVDGKEVASLKAGEKGTVIVNQTPFYAEAGGQVGDHGSVDWVDGHALVEDTQKAQNLILHNVTVEAGELKANTPVRMGIDRARRQLVRANHTATHLLNEALREVLGASVAQRGSLNDTDRLRFDFSYNHALTHEELSKVSAEVNAHIRDNSQVSTRIMTPDEARALGAQALFGEKYGEEVRVVSMGTKAGSGKGTDGATYSIELCGGTHVNHTGEIGAFVILSDSASSAGVRRVEALTGDAARKHIEAQLAIVANLASTLKAKPEEISGRIEQLMQERRNANEEISNLKRKLATGGGGNSFEAETVNGTSFFATTLEDVPGKELASLIDEYKGKIGSGVVAIFAVNDGRVAVAIGVTSDLTKNVSAKALVQTTTPLIGGKGGGGRDDFAQGGGSDHTAIPKAVENLKSQL